MTRLVAYYAMQQGLFRGREWWKWALCLGLIAAGLVRWAAVGPRPEIGTLTVPYRPPTVDPALPRAAALPLDPGQLEGWNVVIATLDTTRPDRIGCYGNREIATPTLDGLASRGAIFSDALAVAPTTLPSHASIFTGLYPHHHGARANGIYPLAAGPVTLAEVLGDHGYDTGAAVSSFIVDARFGLAQGFSWYDDETANRAAAKSPEGGETRWLHEASRASRDPERRADATTDRAIAWLRRSRERPFFLWVHYYDPHAGYEPPVSHAGASPANPYDGEITFMDAEFGRLLATLEETGAADRTLIVALADHGESLGDHGELTHGFLLHEATLRIPLILRAGDLLGGVHVDPAVSQVDVMPTVLSLLNVPHAAEFDGVDLTQEPPSQRALLSETLQGWVEYGWAPLAAFRAGNDKYIHGPRPELYHLADDPLEERDLARLGQDVAPFIERLASAVGGDSTAALAPAGARLDPADAARLEALGYVVRDAGAPPSLSDLSGLPDAKAMLPVLNRVQSLVFGEIALRGAPAVIADLEEIAVEYPRFSPTFRYLGELHRAAGDLPAAERAFQRAVEISPGATPLESALTEVLISQGRHDAAAERLDALISKHPSYFEGHYNLGVLRLSAGRSAEAADLLMRAFAIDPEQPLTLEPLAKAMAATGRSAELEATLRARLEVAPEAQHVRKALAGLRTSPRNARVPPPT